MHREILWAILGHNGSGKSTFATDKWDLLPSEGTVLISNMDTRDDTHLLDIRKIGGDKVQ